MTTAVDDVEIQEDVIAGLVEQGYSQRNAEKSEPMVDPDAIAEYVNSLRPSARLKYYRLTKGERLTVEAMLNCTKGTGQRVFATTSKLAELAGLNKRTVQAAIHGYKRKDGTRHQGLLARHILSQTAPAGDHIGATYAVNWQNFVIEPRQLRALERRWLQRILPGMEEGFPPFPQAPIAFPQKRGAAAAPQGCSGLTPGMQRIHPRGAADAPVVEKLVVNCSLPIQQDRFSPDSEQRIAEIIARSAETAVFPPPKGTAKPNPKAKASWETLHPGIRTRIQKQLDLIHQAVLGSPSPWPAGYCPTAHEYAREKAGQMRLACERAEIWEHVKEGLVQEVYIRVIASRTPKGGV